MKSETTPARFIREQVFRCRTQQEFAELLGYEQATVSRFENGTPFSSEAQRRIRLAAEARKIAWDNNWFFEVPTEPTGCPKRRPGVSAAA